MTVLRVLLVEDNPVNHRLATRMREKRGHRVTLTGNGREAREKGNFDLGVMDVQTPEMDGFQATAAIREGGMHGYFTKPIRPWELDDVLEG